MSANPHIVGSPYLREKDAAAYACCSVSAFREMGIPACNSGGRKVYDKTVIDAAIRARAWRSSTNAAPATTWTGQKVASDSGAALANLTPQRHHVQKLAGHSSVQVTEKYAHHAPNQGVSEVAKLEQWHNSGTPAQLTEKKASKIKRPRSSVG